MDFLLQTVWIYSKEHKDPNVNQQKHRIYLEKLNSQDNLNVQ